MITEKQPLNWHQQMAAQHARLDEDTHAETLFISLRGQSGPTLQQGQRCYFGYTSQQFRRVTGIQNASYGKTFWTASQTYTIPARAVQSWFTLTLIDRNGERRIEDMPLVRLGWLNNIINFGGKIMRFDIDVNMHESFLTFIAPSSLASTNLTIPLTFYFGK